MANKAPVHVIPHIKGGWAVSREGAKRPSSTHPTQKEAAAQGKAVALRDRTEFVLYGKNGQIRAKSNFQSARPSKN